MGGTGEAEAHGVTQANVATRRQDQDPVARRLAGAEPWIGTSLGIADDGFARAIAAVGNYGEIYDRDVTAPLGLPRGRNELAEKGGMMWALPVEPSQ
jgi:general L-amino acid transport system substrate-binding protein